VSSPMNIQLQNSLARVTLPPDGSNTNLRCILHLVLVWDTGSVEHSLQVV
jgi:hypothetical protein